jgi:CDP-glucose 4,6-dehydratase
MIREGFWRNRRVFITGHTGFKGGWLAHWLTILGANVYGYALNSSNELDFFQATNLLEKLEGSTIGDIRDLDLLKKSVLSSNPEIVIHMAAQSLVRRSYSDPLNTFSTNLIGILNLLDAIMYSENVRAVINVTTDKCYENNDISYFLMKKFAYDEQYIVLLDPRYINLLIFNLN